MKIFSVSFVAGPFLISKRRRLFSDQISFMPKMKLMVPFVFLMLGGFLLLVGYLVKPTDSSGNILFSNRRIEFSLRRNYHVIAIRFSCH